MIMNGEYKKHESAYTIYIIIPYHSIEWNPKEHNGYLNILKLLGIMGTR